MSNKINPNTHGRQYIICILLVVASLAVFWQVHQYHFINYDDNVYVTHNHQVRSGVSIHGLQWAFSTIHAQFWQPLTWLSLMLDYQINGLQAGGFHVTNLVLHLLSTLLLFGLLNRMTGAIWRSAFVAAVFAIHPLHVETVTWIAKRKDVLSAFFWMLTLWFYVHYSEKPDVKRYLLILISFLFALMSKPMVVTLPAIMILLDYWPLKRFDARKDNAILWQIKEKTPFFILSAFFAIITVYARDNTQMEEFTLGSRLANAPVSFVTYLIKTFWPYDLAVFYPFSDQLPLWQVSGSILLVMVISVAVILAAKRMPYLLVGWFWYAIILFPVMGIVQVSPRVLSDNYMYLSLTGITVGMTWGISLLFPSEYLRKKFLLPMGIIMLAFLCLISWKQCRYWQNDFILWNHACMVTNDSYLAHNNLASELAKQGRITEAITHYDKAIHARPDLPLSYNGRGLAYDTLGQYMRAIENYNHALRVQPDYAEVYYNRGNSYDELGQYELAIKDYNEAIRLKPDYVQAYNNRGNTYFSMRKNAAGCRDAQKACMLKNCRLLEIANNNGLCR